MLNFNEFLQEERNLHPELTVLDIDDTLFHTTAQIAVIKDGETIKKLTNQEYNTYNLEKGETFDFTEFRDADKFYHESKPITRMMEKAKAILSNSLKNTLNKVIIVTARANFDNKDKFLATFRKHGFDIDKVRVERAGNIDDIHVGADRKYIIIRNYLKAANYAKVRLFDDAMANLKVFLKLQTEFPGTKFEAYFVKTDGSIKTVK